MRKPLIHTNLRPAAGHRGSAMIIAILAILVVASTAAAGLMAAIARSAAVSSSMARMNALYAAESGVKEVLNTMNQQAAVAARGGAAMSIRDGQVITGTYSWGRYQVTVRTIPGTQNWRVTSLGFCDSTGGVRSREVRIALTPIIKNKVSSRFGFALFSDLDMNLLNGNGFTDSYDSAVGAYLPHAPVAPFSINYQNANGSIGSNHTIDVPSGGTELHGAVNPGPGYAGAIGGLTSEGIKNLPAPIALPPIPDAEWQAARAVNDNGSIVTLGGGSAYAAATQSLSVSSKQTVTLGTPGGPRRTYYFTSVATSGSGQKINIVGPSTIYLNGSWTQNGSSEVNALGKPTDLQIYGVGTGTITLNGSSGFGAGIYAPQMTVRFNGAGDMRGGYVGRQIIRNGNWNFHYDEALGRVYTAAPAPTVIGYRATGWNEKSTSN